MALELGQVLEGKYRIVRLIGEGGMGAVYEGENIRIQRRVAIKVVHPAFASDTEVIARFQREAQAAGRIGNDHIVEVLDLGVLPDGSHFMVLEYLDGEPLSVRIKRLGRLDPSQTAAIARQILNGLAAAHGAGIVHRDLKPDNVFILKEKAGTPDYVKLIDFGISKFQPLSGDGMKMTSSGAVMGTPYYMSPEQASGSLEADGRSDLFTVGVIVYECVTGRIPFEGESFNQLMFKIVLTEPPHPQDVVPELDPAFTSIILKAMVRDVTQRFQTAKEFADAIQAWIETGAHVSVPPPPESAELYLGVTRPPRASARGPIPRPTANGNVAARATTGTWATSQPGASPSRSAVTYAIAGGVLLAAGALAAVLVLRSGPRTPNVEAPSRATAPASLSPVAAPAAPSVSAPASAAAPIPAPSADNMAPAPTQVAAAPSVPRGNARKPGATQKSAKHPGEQKPAAASGNPDFGY
jgi:serine/threonine-protein kinase